MSLQVKTLLTIGIVLVALIVALFVVSQTVLLNSFQTLEAEDMRQNVGRVLKAIDDQLASLSRANRDWSQWDDTYAFIEDGNADYIDANMSDVFLVNLGINVMDFVNLEGASVLRKAVDLESEAERDVPDGIDSAIAPDSPLLVHDTGTEDTRGLLLLPENPMLVVSRAIVDNEAALPPRGSLIWGRFLDAAEIESLSVSLDLPITVARADSPDLPADFAQAQSAITEAEPIAVRPLSNDTVAGYTLLNDINGNPAIWIRVELPRSIYAQGQATSGLLLAAVGVASVVFGVGILLLLRGSILAPLSRMNNDLDEITQAGDLSQRMKAKTDDELGQLGSNINRMLAALEQHENRLHERDVRLRAVVASAPIILWAVDAQEHFTLVDGKGLDVLGIDPKDAVGKKASEVFKNVPHMVEEIRRALRGEAFASLVPVREYTFDTRYTPLRDAQGNVTGAIGVATDITERTMAERALGDTYNSLNQQNQRLERMNEFFRSTVSVMHETVERGAPAQEIKEYLTYVRKQFDRLD